MKKTNTNLRVSGLEAENARLASENERMKADLDYIAMMSGVEIENEEEEYAQPEI